MSVGEEKEVDRGLPRLISDSVHDFLSSEFGGVRRWPSMGVPSNGTVVGCSRFRLQEITLEHTGSVNQTLLA